MAHLLPRVRVRLICLLALGAVLLPAAAGAQVPAATPARSETTASLGTQPEAPATPEEHELKAGNVLASVTVLRSAKPFPAGGPAFAQIMLSNTAAKGHAGAELLLEAETAVIRDVSVDSVSVEGEADRVRTASVSKIARGRPVKVLVELGLREGSRAPPAEPVENSLKITLRDPAGSADTATLKWDVKNCAGGYYAEIVRVRESSGAGISEALEKARARDRSRPGRWLFPPRAFSRPKKTCLQSVKRWDRRRGRMVYICTKYEEPDEDMTVTPVKFERSIYRLASALVHARAIDRELSRTRDSGWAATRVSQNLEGFLKQDNSPAICTGTISFFDYFEKRMAGFVKRAGSHREMAAKSWALARLRTGEAIKAAGDDTGGHPGWGTAPLDPQRDTQSTTLKHMTLALAQLTGDAALGQSVSDAQNTFAALTAMSAFFRSDAAKTLDDETRAFLRRALSAIEAADYIGTVARHYTDLDHALLGSMTVLRQAHARNCTCGG